MIASKSSIKRHNKRQEKDNKISQRLAKKFQRSFPRWFNRKLKVNQTHKQRRIDKLIARGVIVDKESDHA